MVATALNLQTVYPEDAAYPAALKTCTAFKTAPTLAAIGSFKLFARKTIALFYSKQCPGDLILRTYDLTQALRDAKNPVISGFHTPIEQNPNLCPVAQSDRQIRSHD